MSKGFKSLYISQSTNPYDNLAMEEYLISICQPTEIIMYLWQNENTIVIGKHQNPYKECNLTLLKADGIHLVRRKSGGGAVYHDLGNLNFTFIAHDQYYNIEQNFKVIINALKEFHIDSEQTGRNDLTVNSKKISGSAFIHEKDINCHHGTLLVDAKLDKLAKYLTPSKIKIASKGVASVRARVTNLKNLNPAIKLSDLKEELIRAFDSVFLGELKMGNLEKNPFIIKTSQQYANWDWNIGESPKATLTKSSHNNWGNVEVAITLHNGQISYCNINSDTLENINFTTLAQNLKGKKFDIIQIEQIILQFIDNKTIANDLIKLFKELSGNN